MPTSCSARPGRTVRTRPERELMGEPGSPVRERQRDPSPVAVQGDPRATAPWSASSRRRSRIAMTKAFLAVNGGQGAASRARARAGHEADRGGRRARW